MIEPDEITKKYIGELERMKKEKPIGYYSYAASMNRFFNAMLVFVLVCLIGIGALVLMLV